MENLFEKPKPTQSKYAPYDPRYREPPKTLTARLYAIGVSKREFNRLHRIDPRTMAAFEAGRASPLTAGRIEQRLKELEADAANRARVAGQYNREDPTQPIKQKERVMAKVAVGDGEIVTYRSDTDPWEWLTRRYVKRELPVGGFYWVRHEGVRQWPAYCRLQKRDQPVPGRNYQDRNTYEYRDPDTWEPVRPPVEMRKTLYGISNGATPWDSEGNYYSDSDNMSHHDNVDNYGEQE